MSVSNRDIEKIPFQKMDARVYRRTLALLQLDRGKDLCEVAQELGVSRQSVYNWKHGYEQGAKDADVLADAARSGRPSVWTEERERLLRTALDSCPQRWGYTANGWTAGLLQRYLTEHSGQTLSRDSIRRHLHALGYTWKPFRYVLKAAPEREKKRIIHRKINKLTQRSVVLFEDETEGTLFPPLRAGWCVFRGS